MGPAAADWVDLGLDGHTILYDGEGTLIRTFDLRLTPRGRILPPLQIALSLRSG